MATLFLTAWEDAEEVALGDILQTTTVNISASSTKSTAISGTLKKRRRVRFFADEECFVTWGEDPTATDGDNSIPMGRNNPEYFDIQSGYKIAVIERT